MGVGGAVRGKTNRPGEPLGLPGRREGTFRFGGSLGSPVGPATARGEGVPHQPLGSQRERGFAYQHTRKEVRRWTG